MFLQPAKASKLEKATTSFQPVKALLLEPVKALTLLMVLLQPVKAPPPGGRPPRPYIPWWRVRMDRAGDLYLCYPNGFWRELDQEEAEEVEQWMIDSEAIDDYYITHQTQWCEQSGNWQVPFAHPLWSLAWQGYQFPGFDHSQAPGHVDYYAAWEQESGHWVLACMPGSSASSSTQPGKGYGKNPYGGAQPGKGYPKGSQPAKGSSKGKPGKKGSPGVKDVLGDLTRGAGSRARRDARRALEEAGLKVPDSLKPGKAIDDLDPEARDEAKDLQRRLKELTWSSSLPARSMQLEIANVKKKLKELLTKEEEEEEEDEQSDQPPSENSSSSSCAPGGLNLVAAADVQAAELEKAREELAKAQAELQAAQDRLAKRKKKKA